ncbi:MAG: 30S ribosomal protein S2 [Ignavibacteriales bacterium]|nr:30S ribosomal protein S2 [Ignavibacteriales bacterium]
MPRVELTQLIEAGAHFGHLTRRWNPKMKPFIFMEKNGIHIIDLKKTQAAVDAAAEAMTEIVSQGKRVLFVGTKKQAKGTVASEARRSDSNWVSERWLGGMLTNFQTIRKSIKHLQNIEKMESDGTFEKITKKERLVLTREKDKLRKVLDGVETLAKMPGALFIVDIKKESIAVNEALKLNIPIFAIVDTNCDPDPVDYIIPANDDASRAVEVITKVIADAVIEGNLKGKELRAHEVAEKEKDKKDEQDTEKKDSKGKVRRVKIDGREDRRPQQRDRRDNRSERPAPRREDKPVEKPVDKPVEKPADKPADVAENKSEEKTN